MDIMHIEAWLHSLSPLLIYFSVVIIVGMESLGIPLPGETILMSASLLASHGIVNPWVVWLCGATGAIVGDSIGYYFGHTYGNKLLERLGRRFPRHINEHTTLVARKIFRRYGLKTVFFGRFIAILRIFAGPLAGILRMPYRKFLLANACGGIVWSGLVVWSVYYLGILAEHWLSSSSWIIFLLTLILGSLLSVFFRHRFDEYIGEDSSTAKRNNTSTQAS